MDRRASPRPRRKTAVRGPCLPVAAQVWTQMPPARLRPLPGCPVLLLPRGCQFPRRPGVPVTHNAPFAEPRTTPPHPRHLHSQPLQWPPGSQARSRGGSGRSQPDPHSAVPLGKGQCPMHTRPHLGADGDRGYMNTGPQAPSPPLPLAWPLILVPPQTQSPPQRTRG